MAGARLLPAGSFLLTSTLPRIRIPSKSPLRRAIPTEGAGTAHSLRRYGTNLSRYLDETKYQKGTSPGPPAEHTRGKTKKEVTNRVFRICCRRYSYAVFPAAQLSLPDSVHCWLAGAASRRSAAGRYERGSAADSGRSRFGIRSPGEGRGRQPDLPHPVQEHAVADGVSQSDHGQGDQ